MEKEIKYYKLYEMALLLVFGVLLFFVGWFSHGIKYNPKNASSYELRESGYKYINPLLECENSPSELFTPELKEIVSKAKQIESENKESGDIEHLSLYFRDLTNGPWVGLNENDFFSPASLLKVPLMIATYKQAESDKDFLKKDIAFVDATISKTEQNIRPEKSIQINQSYTVGELIEYMLDYSDNNAQYLLLDNLDKDVLNKAFQDLGIPSPTIEKSEDFMSVKEYSSFFRILYNSSYLSREYSEKALEIMIHSQFDKGIKKHIPSYITVSHKFGERGFPNSSTKQLHDCGIVYYPKHPYLVCIMTRGSDFEKLAEVIAEVSKDVFEVVDEKYNEQLSHEIK